MKQSTRSVGTLPALLLTCLFAFCVFLVTASGARLYREISAATDTQYGCTTAVSYAVTKVRHYDEAGGVTVGSLGAVPALVLSQQIDGQGYQTFLYCYDGYLRELFCPAGSGEFLEASAGEAVLAVDAFSFTWSPESAMLDISCTAAGETACQSLLLRSAGGDAL